MSFEQWAIGAVIVSTLVLFAWGPWRFDLVALASLLTCVALGLVPGDEAFLGFGNAAVITVASVFIISHSLARAGVVDLLAARLRQHARTRFQHLVSLCLGGAALSAFMNNVGALALLMPVALSMARSHGYSAAILLMPMSFATLLGGMTTLIGTPPNILISDFRARALGERFHMFDFSPVGLAVALVGIAFVVLIGWRLIPRERRGQRPADAIFEISHYVTEARVPEDAYAVGETVPDFESRNSGVTVIGIIRRHRRLLGRLHFERIAADDVLLLQTDSAGLRHLVAEEGLLLVEREKQEEGNAPDRLTIYEAVVRPDSWILDASAASLQLRQRWGVNLVAISREGRPMRARLRSVRFTPGDVLLLEGDEAVLPDVVSALGCLPLADRKLTIQPRRVALPLGIFMVAIAAAALGGVSTAIAFGAAALLMPLLGVIRPTQIYDAIDWPVLVLVAAMIPVGGALQTTGATDQIADLVAAVARDVGPRTVLAIVLVTAMAITPVLNNAATVIILAPITLGIAGQLDLNPDPFLIALAVGASCDFLTPFGHQNNTIILGPGGYRFGDFLWMGLPLEILVIAVTVLVVPLVWPFT